MSDGKKNNPTQQNGQELTCFETFEDNETQKSMVKRRKKILGQGYQSDFKRKISEALFIRTMAPDL